MRELFVVTCLSASIALADPPNLETPIKTQHAVTIGGEAIQYTATTGRTRMTDYDGKPKADLFSIAYTKDGADPATRPVTFCFNGGPGSSSVWLHMGAIGPRLVRMDDEGFPLPPPGEYVENEHSWLDLTDLVFIDPVGTGYSRMVEGENDHEYHGLDRDVGSVGEFIRLWITREQRWLSPKVLCGESYGTTRAAGLAGELQNEHGMYINGIILVSPVLDFSTIRFADNNDAPYWLYLPTYAATAFYHGKVAPDVGGSLRPFLAEVEEFAEGDYLLALARGDGMPADERWQVVRRVARYTGLSEEFVDDADLRISQNAFCKELLRDKSRTVGRLDGRYTGIDGGDLGTSTDYDPSYAAIQGPYTACFNAYVRVDLRYESDMRYEILTGRVHPWDMGADERYPDVSGRLRRAMNVNRDLHVLVCCGYFDMATPYFAAEYTMDHLGLDESLRGNVSLSHFESGHMMYVRRPDLVELKDQVRGFVARAIRARE